jgi:cystathionine gamma-synthase
MVSSVAFDIAAARLIEFCTGTTGSFVPENTSVRASIEGQGTPVPGDLLRLSAGIEDPAELLADLGDALNR